GVVVEAFVLEIVLPTNLPGRHRVSEELIDLRAVRVADRGQHAPVHLALPPRRIDRAAGGSAVLDPLNVTADDALHDAAAGHRLPQVLRDAVLIAVALTDPDDEPFVVRLPFLARPAAALEVGGQFGAARDELVAPDVPVPLTDREADVRVVVFRHVEARGIRQVLCPPSHS